jgi:hypothetical protein
MIKIILLYMLLITSIAFPPLFIVSAPLTIIAIRRVVRRRRQILETATAIVAERTTANTVKFFR